MTDASAELADETEELSDGVDEDELLDRVARTVEVVEDGRPE